MFDRFRVCINISKDFFVGITATVVNEFKKPVSVEALKCVLNLIFCKQGKMQRI